MVFAHQMRMMNLLAHPDNINELADHLLFSMKLRSRRAFRATPASPKCSRPPARATIRATPCANSTSITA